MSDTLQRLKDLEEIADNKEVRLLAKILQDYVKDEEKVTIGFKQDIKEVKEKVE